MSRYGPEAGTAAMVASWSAAGNAFPLLTRVALGGRNVHTLVLETGLPVRIDDRSDVSGPDAAVPAKFGDRVEALGGQISLHSPPGAGTTLDIVLPL